MRSLQRLVMVVARSFKTIAYVSLLLFLFMST
jgi:hypothetical protein